MRLITTTQVTVDGVLQGLGGAEEDRRGGFTRGGWAFRHGDAAVGEHVTATYRAASAFLFGRWTYDLFAGYWGAMDPAAHPIAAALHDRPRYVVSSRPVEPSWPGTQPLTGDVTAAVQRLRAEGEGDLLVPGSGTLVRWLLAHDLVDELELLVYPVVVGQGTRLLPQDGPQVPLDLLSSWSTPGGVLVQRYRPGAAVSEPTP
jgi:dihydrofolate reductase